MFHNVLNQVKRRASGQRAYRYVEAISGYHRIQASPGFRAAAHYCLDQLRAAGVEAQLHSYPASYDHHYWGQQLFPEWECTSAELELIEPQHERLCCFAEDKISLIQRSTSTPPGGIETELVAISDSHRPESYEEIDVAGKMVLIDGDINQSFRQAVKNHGAVGLVTDRMPEFLPVRHRMDMGDALCYTSFWWAPEDEPCFGFVISPKTGERLRSLLKKQTLRVKAQVEAKRYDGKMDVLDAFIPGETDEEIVVVAHLCHPQASANDNASGAGAAMESARCLAELIRGGVLPQPKRGIRFLLVPEVYGTNCYLARNEEKLPLMVAALNLDMVGENQERCGSVLLVENPARSTPSYTGALLESILREISQDAQNLAGTSGYALFRWATTPFSGGSDHYVFSDPTVDVPCPMLIQWPDKYYHTNQDTIDKVDPAMLERIVLLTATYAYYLASAQLNAALFLGQEMVASFSPQVHAVCARRLPALLQAEGNVDGSWASLEKQLRFLFERQVADLNALARLVSADQQAALQANIETWVGQLQQALSAELSRAQSLMRAEGKRIPAPALVERQLDEMETKASQLIPLRLSRGPCGLGDRLQNRPVEERMAWEKWTSERKRTELIFSHSLYWMDGKRDLLTIADLVELETGRRDLETLLGYAKMMAKLELLKLNTR